MPASRVRFDLDEIPFSRRGGWFGLSPVVALHTRRPDVHLVSHRNGMHAVLRLVPERDGRPVPHRREAEPALLRFADEAGAIEATWDSPARLRIRGRGLGLRLQDPSERLTPFTGSYLVPGLEEGVVVLTSYETGYRYRITVLQGSPVVEGAEALGDAVRAVTLPSDGEWELLLEESSSGSGTPVPTRTFDATVDRVRREFDKYAAAVIPAPVPVAGAKAAYVLWSATVAPAGLVTRESVLMSKHWMDKLWSWDHCFNALALAEGEPEAAWSQFLAPFDHQDAAGALPDSITHSEVLYNFVKPPIHGWTLQLLRARMPRPLTRDELTSAYDRLSRWTGYWLTERRSGGSALPVYQHGNDSGWDNSTMFDRARLVRAPDLAAFLLLQLGALEQLGRELQQPVEHWGEEARAIHDELFASLWTGEDFVARDAVTGEAGGTRSLLNCMPIVLGDALPPEVSVRLAERIAEHLTEWGLATEPTDSPDYEPDGYWRGPIWAPSTVLVEDGLRRAGHVDLADAVRTRFLELCRHGGFAENFDAVTGEGLRDRAYTWTAAAYLLFAAPPAGASGDAAARLQVAR